MAIPPASYYENPYPPTAGDRNEYPTIPLLPVEAHSILVDAVDKPITTIDRLTLQRIAESDDDEPIDFQAVRRQIMAELDTDDDWD